MSFRNHRNKIKRYRVAGKMLGEAFASDYSREKVAKIEALEREYANLGLPGYAPYLLPHELRAAIDKATGGAA